MNIAVERLPECRANLRAEIPADRVTQEREGILASFASQARIPGFRPGKAPSRVLEKRFGSQIDAELQDRLVRAAFQEAIQKEELNVLGVEDVNDIDFADDGTLTFTAVLTLSPEVELPDLKGIKVEIPKLEIGEEQIDQSIEQLRERFAEFNEVEGRTLAMGDLAVIDYTGTIDGAPAAEAFPEGGEAFAGKDDYWIRMDEETFFPGFCAGLDGAAIDEQREVTIDLPDDFPNEDLRGKQTVYSVTLKGIKEQVLPEVTDEFANQIQEGLDVEALRTAVKEDLDREWEQQVQNLKTNQILDHLSANTEFELPESVVSEETQHRANRMAADAQQRGMPEDEIMAKQDEIIEGATEQAKMGVKTSFILGEIAKAEKLSPTEDELRQELTMMAVQSGEQPKKFFKDFEKKGDWGPIRHRLTMDKAMNFLRENCEVTYVDPPKEGEEKSED